MSIFDPTAGNVGVVAQLAARPSWAKREQNLNFSGMREPPGHSFKGVPAGGRRSAKRLSFPLRRSRTVRGFGCPASIPLRPAEITPAPGRPARPGSNPTISGNTQPSSGALRVIVDWSARRMTRLSKFKRQWQLEHSKESFATKPRGSRPLLHCRSECYPF